MPSSVADGACGIGELKGVVMFPCAACEKGGRGFGTWALMPTRKFARHLLEFCAYLC